MTLTGRTIESYFDEPRDVEALARFASCLSLDSRTISAENGTEHISDWSMRFKTNQLLADVYDMLSSFRYAFLKVKKQKPRKPEPYPRPWLKQKQKIGKKPIRITKFWGWWNGKRR